MGASLKHVEKQHSPAWQGVPLQWRVLYIHDRKRTGGWLIEGLVSESPAEIEIHEAPGSVSGLARLRDEMFEVVYIAHAPPELDALELVSAYRTGGSDDPLIILGRPSEQELAVPAFQAGADGYLCVSTATTQALIWTSTRSVQRCQLLRQNRRFLQAEKQRVQKEREEAQRLLKHQWAVVQTLERKKRSAQHDHESATASDNPQGFEEHGLLSQIPQSLIAHYRELLRAYVIMGTGYLGSELHHLAEVFATAGLAPREVMQLHLHVTGELLKGLGSRSTRHVMTRADLLAIEILLHLAEVYRMRYQEMIRPPVQLVFREFEEAA